MSATMKPVGAAWNIMVEFALFVDLILKNSMDQLRQGMFMYII